MDSSYRSAICVWTRFEVWVYTVNRLHVFDAGSESGGRLNKKDRLTGYGDPHVKDKTSYRPSYL